MKGFSLVESLVVISIITIVVGVFAFVNSTAKSQAVLDKAQTSLISALQEARNRSASGFGDPGYRYGVSVEQNRIVPFRVDENGDRYYEVPTDFPMSISIDQDATIIFDRLNAVSEEDFSIFLRHSSGLEKTITITKDGRINY